MNPEVSAFLVQDGLAVGAIYALLAVALVLILTVTRIIFIPQGEFVSYGALTLVALRTGRLPSTVSRKAASFRGFLQRKKELTRTLDCGVQFISTGMSIAGDLRVRISPLDACCGPIRG